MTDEYPDAEMLRNIRERLPQLKELLNEADGHWRFENFFYRYYYGSFKVYEAQELTHRIADELKNLMPDRELNGNFMDIVSQGTGRVWELSHNQRWIEETLPIINALFHAIYFLRLVVRYGELYDSPPESLKNGYAALLVLYGMR